MTSWFFKRYQFIKYKTLCKIPEVNWLEISDVVRGTQLYHQSFSRRPDTKSTGGLKWAFVFKVRRDYTALDGDNKLSTGIGSWTQV